MALEGTHIRFALDLKNKFQVKDLYKYIAGTVYPDSRYVTKIDRNITHDKNLLINNFYQNNDFKKGWFVHLVCDQVQSTILKQTFPDIVKNDKMSSREWVLKTSLKIIQDIYDVKQFPIKDYLKYLKYAETLNGENIKKLKIYNKIFIDMYQKDKLEIQDSIDMWDKFGIDKKLITQLTKITNQMNSDKKIIDKIPLLYPKMLDFYNNL